MNKIKYKFDNKLWELQESTGMLIDSITFDSTGITQKVNGICFLCHGLVLPEQKGQIKYEVERIKKTDDNGNQTVVSKHIFICGECAER